MLDDVRKYLESAFESLNPSRARELASRITELVQTEVKRQLKSIGIATRDDLDTLRARVRELERSGSGSPGRSSKKSSAKKSSAKRTSAKKSSTKKPGTGRSSAESPASPSSPPSGTSDGKGSSG
jgi:BMFP domain-containing protein YqiC